MKNQQASIEAVLREINALAGQIRTAELDKGAEFKRTKALMTLEGVTQILKGFCLAPEGDTEYWYYEFGSSGK